MSKVVRSVKNVTKGYSHVQVKVRNGMRLQELDIAQHLTVHLQQRATIHGDLQAQR